MELRRLVSCLFVLFVLFGCAKQLEEIPEPPTFSHYRQENPMISLSYGESLELKNDFSLDGHSQTLMLVPRNNTLEKAYDVRLEVQYFRSIPGVTSPEELREYVNSIFPTGWTETQRFGSVAGFKFGELDQKDHNTQIWLFYFLSDRNEVYRVRLKEGNVWKVSSDLRKAWESLSLDLSDETRDEI